MPNLNDFSPDERQAYLNWLQKKQAASDGVMTQAAGDMAGLENQYAQMKPDAAAIADAQRSDAVMAPLYGMMASIRGSEGNVAGANYYARAAQENPQQTALESKNKQFLDYLKGLSGMQAQRYGVAIPAAQKAEANATEALGNYDKLQATTEQKKQELAARADENAKNRDQRAQHDQAWTQVMAGNAADRRAQNEFNREMAKQSLEIRKTNADREAEKEQRASAKFDSTQKSVDPDYEVSPGYTIGDPVELRKSHEAYRSTMTLREAIPELKGLMEKYGRGIKLSPTEMARASTLATDIQLRMKGEDQYGLGVLTGPDMEILRKAIPEPGVIDWGYLMKTGPAKLDQTLANINRNYDSHMRSIGYRRVGGGKQPVEAKPKEVSAPMRVRNPQTGQTALVHPNGMDQAIAAGFTEQVPQ